MNPLPSTQPTLSSEGMSKSEALAIITGADGGMGYEITKAVAQQGYHVIMACYCPSKAETKRLELIQETGNPKIEVIGIDLANLSSVRSFTDHVCQHFSQVNLLMNNAGTMETGRHYTVDGLERTVSVNYVGPYLLTRLLFPLMGQGSRIVNMASCVYCLGRLHFPDFFERGKKGSFWRIPVYSNTKLAITLFTLDLAKRVESQGITVNAADPGIVDTEIIRMQMFFDPLTDIFFRPFIYTPRQGADTAIHLLLDEDKSTQTGTFCRSNRIISLSDKYLHHPQMQELWSRTEDIVLPYLD